MELLKAAVAEENLSITVSVVIRELDLLAIAARTDKRGVAIPARVQREVLIAKKRAARGTLQTAHEAALGAES